eukprot:9267991-Pyramimonas_sp.AAC.1
MAASKAQLRRLLAKMTFDEKFGGLGLNEDFPGLGLPAGHKLIADENVRDIHGVGDLEVPEDGLMLSFWDTKQAGPLNMMCVLFSIIGLTMETVHLDSTHVIVLGVLQFLAGAIFHYLIEGNFAHSN